MFMISKFPANGIFVMNNVNTGAFIYYPNENFTGTDSIEFYVNDSETDSNGKADDHNLGIYPGSNTLLRAIGSGIWAITIFLQPDGQSRKSSCRTYFPIQ
jgi:hypothetical protein